MGLLLYNSSGDRYVWSPGDSHRHFVVLTCPCNYEWIYTAASSKEGMIAKEKDISGLKFLFTTRYTTSNLQRRSLSVKRF